MSCWFVLWGWGNSCYSVCVDELLSVRLIIPNAVSSRILLPDNLNPGDVCVREFLPSRINSTDSMSSDVLLHHAFGAAEL
jgi:hypothetical protein